ncbi:NlpC/P60 family protein [Plantactinospora sp. GCM10030261]|uniref:C40 family peptidase n=1 Tax=Plantactinospora sp. GCM10030261 TaxID=3273420 RepID=UPI00360EBA47
MAALVSGLTVALGLPPTAVVAAPDPADVEVRITAAAERLEIVIEDYNDLRERLRDTQERIAGLGVELTTLERDLAAHRDRVGDIAASVYRTGRADTLAVLAVLDGNTVDLVDSLMTIQKLGHEQRGGLLRLTAARDRLAVASREARALATEQRAAEQRLGARKRQIEREIAELEAMRRTSRAGRTDESPGRAAGADRTTAPPNGHRPFPAKAGPAATAVRFAHAQLGKPYRWGGSGPDGFDCSGLTSAAWAAAGVRLPHNAARQWRAVSRVSRTQLRPGDLVFYYADIHHVGLYVGSGKVIHAPRTGERIRIDAVDYQPVHGYGRPG